MFEFLLTRMNQSQSQPGKIPLATGLMKLSIFCVNNSGYLFLASFHSIKVKGKKRVLKSWRILKQGTATATAQKMKFSIKDFFSKCDQISSFLQIWSNLLKKCLMKNLIFCAVSVFEIDALLEIGTQLVYKVKKILGFKNLLEVTLFPTQLFPGKIPTLILDKAFL